MSFATLSDRKIEANRQNALKSTGPKSDAGKARAAQNARKYGIFCKDLLVSGEDPAVLEEFKRDMLRSLNPCTAMELQLAEQIIADEWRIKRVRGAERAVFERIEADDRRRFEQQLANDRTKREQMGTAVARAFAPDTGYSRRYPQFREEYVRLTQEFAKAREADPSFKPRPPAQTLEQLMHDGPELERLQKYEQRLRNSVYRALKEFRELRSHDLECPSGLTEDLLGVAAGACVENEANNDANDDEVTSSVLPDEPMEPDDGPAPSAHETEESLERPGRAGRTA